MFNFCTVNAFLVNKAFNVKAEQHKFLLQLTEEMCTFSAGIIFTTAYLYISYTISFHLATYKLDALNAALARKKNLPPTPGSTLRNM